MKLIEGSFDNPEVNNLLEKHFKELRSVLDKYFPKKIRKLK